MANAEFTAEVFSELEAGNYLGDTRNIIELVSDNGARTWNVVKETVKGFNGNVANMFVAASTAVIGGVNSAVSAGAAMMAIETGALGMAIAPAMGISGGYLLYNIAPDFWDKVALDLTEAGWTIGNKVICFMNEAGELVVPHDIIEMVKARFYEEGYLDTASAGELDPIIPYTPHFTYSTPIPMLSSITVSHDWNWTGPTDYNIDHITYSAENAVGTLILDGVNYDVLFITKIYGNIMHTHNITILNNGTVLENDYDTPMTREVIVNGESYYVAGGISGINTPNFTTTFSTSHTTSSSPNLYNTTSYTNEDIINYFFNNTNVTNASPYLEADAVIPGEDDFTQALPGWQSWDTTIPYPVITDFDFGVPYPLTYPYAPSQAIAINPAIDLADAIDIVLDPAITPDVAIPMDVVIDLDVPAVPEPIVIDTPAIITPEPIDPDPVIPASPAIPDVVLPDTVSSNKLFSVYNPTSSQLDQLGGYLWSANVLDELKRIWQDPLDGVISLLQVYCTPTSGSSRHIILGCLDSEVSAKVVTSQFVTIDCGSINLAELNKNVTDYAPYTSLHIYLPFIGFTELDINECMRGLISVKYKVDVYTGTCLAEVKVVRNPDIPNGAVLYTFNGNCSQQIPLTSSNASGMLGAIIGAVGFGLSVASGGNLGVMAGANMVGHTVNREMLHVSHSGNLSANSGIMGQKKPYLIIGRARPYNAQNFNTQYGYPINQTSYLNNCRGFTRVKSVRLKTSATDAERQEILELLEEGVFM